MRHPDDRTVDHHGCVLRCRELLGLDQDLVPVRNLCFGVRSRDVPRSTELRLVRPGLRLQRHHIGLGGVQRHGKPQSNAYGHAAGVVYGLVCRSRRLPHLLWGARAAAAAASVAASIAASTTKTSSIAACAARIAFGLLRSTVVPLVVRR